MVGIFENSTLILTLLGVYFAIIIALGFYASKRKKNSEDDQAGDFILADRNLSTPYVTASVVATWIGAAIVIGGATEVFTGGFQYIVWDPFGATLTLFVTGFFMATTLRRSKSITVIDFFTQRFDRRIGFISVVIEFMAALVWISSQLLAFGVLIRLTTGLGETYAVIAGTIVVLILAMAGGLWALSRSDMIAFIIISIALVIMLPYALGSVGGIGNLIENATNLDGAPQFSVAYSFQPAEGESGPYGFYGYTGILGMLYFLVSWVAPGLGDSIGPTMTARVLAAKDEKSARRGFIYGGIIYLFLGMIPVVIGMCVSILKPDFPSDQLDDILPWFVQNYVPEWVGIMFFLALAAAIVSTSGDTILASGALLGNSLYKIINPNAGDEARLKLTKAFMPVVALFALLIGIALGGIYNLLIFSSAMAFPTLGVTYLSAIFYKKANATGAFWTMIIGFVSWIAFIFITYPFTEDYWDSIYISSMISFCISIFTIVIVSNLTAKKDPPKVLRDTDGNDISDAPKFCV